MTDIIIPKEAIEAGRRAFANAGTADDDRDPFAEACLALLRNWPGMAYRYRMSVSLNPQEIILPLPKEPEA